MKLSVIIVNYNVKYFLEQCLHAVYNALRELPAEVIVVDNNSVDGSVQMIQEKFPDIVLIANKENVGFAKANNQALAIAQGEYVLLLNPDTLVEEDTFTRCLAFMDQTPDAGALGVKMLNGKGEFLPESKRGLPLPWVAFYKIFGLSKLFPKSKKFGYYHLTYLDKDQIHAVDVLSGAFMMIRASVLAEIGYLDEDYFMYGEDIDLSYRITKSGYKNYYFPETRIIHYKGESTKKGSMNYVFVFYKAMLIFARKHFSKNNARVLNWLITMAIWFRATLSVAKRVVVALVMPVIDFVLIYVALIALSLYWENTVLAARDSGFPDEFFYVVLPLYTLLWIASIALYKGYQKPVQLGATNKGIFLGTVIILLIYALLPEHLRFSRAMVIFGAMWTVIALNLMRYLLHKLQFKNFVVGAKQHRRIAVIGDMEEAKRVATIVQLDNGKTEFIGIVSIEENNNSEMLLGTLSQIKDIIPVFNIKELIFCSENLTAGQIIEQMNALQEFKLDYKIAPRESSTIIGSNSISVFDEIYMFQLHPVTQKENKRRKRLFDVTASFLLILFLPVDIWFVESKRGFIQNILAVLKGKKSWVGCSLSPWEIKEPRLLKQGVLYPADISKVASLNTRFLDKINQMYIQEYTILMDIRILFKGFKYLGRKQ